ncbi:hypothetical protein Dimus_000974, partial [Dionaea muscipula]
MAGEGGRESGGESRRREPIEEDRQRRRDPAISDHRCMDRLGESELGFVGGESAAVGGVRATAGGLVAGHRPLAGWWSSIASTVVPCGCGGPRWFIRRSVVVVVVLGVSPGGPLAASSGRVVAGSLGD